MSPHTTMPFAARTDVGQRRDHNEDAMLAEPPVLAVADGVGGSAKGEVASQLALDTLATHVRELATARSSDDAVHAMEAAVLAANVAVHEAQLADDSLRGMATTLSAVVVRGGGEVVVGHVGDSRVYVCSAAGARQVSDDHSVVAELVRTGRLEAEEAAHHPQRNVITRALGPEADVSVDAFVVHVGPGDWLLVCSDGLTEHVADAELARALLDSPSDPDAALRRLVDLANERGGTDNITVVTAQPVPSDVSGELSIEALEAAATTAQLRALEPSDAPAEASGPMPAVEATTSDELPLSSVEDGVSGWERADDRARRRRGRRSLLWLALLVLVAVVAGSIVWSQSYFLLERGDGRVGIDRGFPFARLASPYRSSDIVAEELEPADRERFVEQHTLRSKDDAERVLKELESRLDPVGEEGAGGVTANT